MNNVLRDIGSHTEITNYKASEESSAINNTNDEGKKFSVNGENGVYLLYLYVVYNATL